MSRSSKDLNNMLCLDLYLMLLSAEEYETIKHRIGPPQENKYPLECWDLISPSHFIDTTDNKQPYDKRRKNSTG